MLNGANYNVWSPSRDEFIARRFSSEAPEGKRECKADLQRRVWLPTTATPLIGMVARLFEQKGLDILVAAADDLLTRGVQLVVLGTGEERYERRLSQLAEQHPSQVAMCLRFDEQLAHVIEATHTFSDSRLLHSFRSSYSIA